MILQYQRPSGGPNKSTRGLERNLWCVLIATRRRRKEKHNYYLDDEDYVNKVYHLTGDYQETYDYYPNDDD